MCIANSIANKFFMSKQYCSVCSEIVNGSKCGLKERTIDVLKWKILVSGEGYLGKNFIDSFLSNLLWG
jgi:hypothetical protein